MQCCLGLCVCARARVHVPTHAQALGSLMAGLGEPYGMPGDLTQVSCVQGEQLATDWLGRFLPAFWQLHCFHWATRR